MFVFNNCVSLIEGPEDWINNNHLYRIYTAYTYCRSDTFWENLEICGIALGPQEPICNSTSAILPIFSSWQEIHFVETYCEENEIMIHNHRHNYHFRRIAKKYWTVYR